MLLTRLAQSLGEEVTKKCLFLPHRVVVKLFVWVDVLCFLLQGSGGGMTAMEGSIAQIGHDVSSSIGRDGALGADLHSAGLSRRSHPPGHLLRLLLYPSTFLPLPSVSPRATAR